MKEGKGRGGALAALLAAGALGLAAVPAYGALSSDGGGSGAGTGQAPAAPGFVQDDQAPEQQRPEGGGQRDEDCPWKDGRGGGSGGGSSPQQGVSFDSASSY